METGPSALKPPAQRARRPPFAASRRSEHIQRPRITTAAPHRPMIAPAKTSQQRNGRDDRGPFSEATGSARPCGVPRVGHVYGVRLAMTALPHPLTTLWTSNKGQWHDRGLCVGSGGSAPMCPPPPPGAGSASPHRSQGSAAMVSCLAMTRRVSHRLQTELQYEHDLELPRRRLTAATIHVGRASTPKPLPHLRR